MSVCLCAYGIVLGQKISAKTRFAAALATRKQTVSTYPLGEFSAAWALFSTFDLPHKPFSFSLSLFSAVTYGHASLAWPVYLLESVFGHGTRGLGYSARQSFICFERRLKPVQNVVIRNDGHPQGSFSEKISVAIEMISLSKDRNFTFDIIEGISAEFSGVRI